MNRYLHILPALMMLITVNYCVNQYNSKGVSTEIHKHVDFAGDDVQDTFCAAFKFAQDHNGTLVTTKGMSFKPCDSPPSTSGIVSNGVTIEPNWCIGDECGPWPQTDDGKVPNGGPIVPLKSK